MTDSFDLLSVYQVIDPTDQSEKRNCPPRAGEIIMVRGEFHRVVEGDVVGCLSVPNLALSLMAILWYYKGWVHTG